MSEIEKQQELRSRIEEEMKPSEGWWRSDTAESFNQVANKLIAGGFSVDDAFDIIQTIYGATKEEYGD